jgi:uncharacterized membrane protein YedE/YeeE
MRSIIVALVAGLLFGVGLTVSRMIDPSLVLAFLDLGGKWNPTLAFVMAGGIPVAALAFVLARRRRAPLCAVDFAAPAPDAIDRRLILGSVIFGVGWGLIGYCPGPALAALGLGNSMTFLFVASMLLGMLAFRAAPALRQSAIVTQE